MSASGMAPTKGFVPNVTTGDWLIIAPTDFPESMPCRVLARCGTFPEAQEKAARYGLSHLLLVRVSDHAHWRRGGEG